jgi:putative NADPH-quinone reductase
MAKRIAIIQGHPDAQNRHYGHALAEAYLKGATEAGHELRVIDIARLDFPLLRSKDEFDHGAPPESICQAQETIRWAEHLVIFYPLWLGSMPALLKAFLEQTFRPVFALSNLKTESSWKKLLKGKSARIVVTMGMPAFFYRWYFRAHSLKSLERNILGFCGIGPIKESLIGMVEAENGDAREKWLRKMRILGSKGQ